MKKIFVCFIMFLCTQSLLSNSVGFKVKCGKDSITKSDIYNNILKQKGDVAFDSVYIIQEYPNAKNKELLKHYYIKFYGKVSKTSLSSLLLETKLFSSVEEEEIFYIEECENPIVVNDSIITNGILNNKALELLDAECAWTITQGDPNIIIGIADTDFDTTQEDLKNQIVSLVGPITDRHYHGTVVSGCAAAETNNGVGIAGIGYNCKIAAHRVSHTTTENGTFSNGDLGTAIWNLYQAGYPIISVSWSGTGLSVDAAREITENGTLLVVSAGGKPDAQNHSLIADIPGVINVSGVDSNNFHGPTGHAHNAFVDVCVMSKDVAVCSTGNTYRTSTGTSPANPQVAGVAALMLSVNRNLTPAQIETIIKETADSINDAHLYPNQLGAGRVNAYSALLKTIDFDLYTKDSELDNGVEPFEYTLYGYNSPDIWVRRSRDGGTEHQSVFNGGRSYVYVRIHNRGSVPSTGREKLLLYRKLATPSCGQWPNSWTIASQDTITIPSIQPNCSTVVCYEVDFPYNPLPNREYSLLTRIISEWDTINIEISDTKENIWNNNNISIKNVVSSNAVIVDDGIVTDVVVAGLDNPTNDIFYTSLRFTSPSNEVGDPLFEEAEIRLVFPKTLVQSWGSSYTLSGAKKINDSTFLVTGSTVKMVNISIPGNYNGYMMAQVNFLTEEYSEKDKYEYIVEQADPTTGEYQTGLVMIVDKTLRSNLFMAEGGNNVVANANTPANLSATAIGEDAVYNWYDASGVLVNSGQNISVTSSATEKYTLEVIAKADGYKDYDSVYVIRTLGNIASISPNPASGQAVVTYNLASSVSSASIVVTNSSGLPVYNSAINVAATTHTLNLQNLVAGQYSLRLVSSTGEVLDTKTLIVQ